jgi:molybdate transport system substrate-binding protein
MTISHKMPVLVCSLVLVFSVQAQTLRIAAASDLQFTMSELGDRFEKKTGIRVAVTFGSSGNFHAQIQNGAPFDLFFSADLLYPQQLISEGLADAQSLAVYAQGHLVLWAPAGANLFLEDRGFEALKDARIQKIAIANPEHAPYGRAAVAALQKAGIYDQIKSKLVFGENISQAAQFAQSGNAQVGIVSLSLTFGEAMKSGERWVIPANLYPPLQQAAVIIDSSSNKAAARAFLKFVKSDEGRDVFLKFGLTSSATSQKQ